MSGVRGEKERGRSRGVKKKEKAGEQDRGRREEGGTGGERKGGE